MNAIYKNPTEFRRDLEPRLKNIATTTNEDLHRLRRKVALDRLLAQLFSEEESKFSKEVMQWNYGFQLPEQQKISWIWCFCPE